MEVYMKTAIYMRVSTQKQNVDSQEHAISLFLKSKSFSNVEFYVDKGESGKKASRPELNRLLNDIKGGKVETLIVYKLDRLFRSLTDLLISLRMFQEHKIVFISIQEQIDLSTPTGVLFMQMLGAFGEFERTIIVERVKAGLENAKAKGKKLGKPSRIPLEVQKQAFTLKESGKSYSEVSFITGLKIPAIQRIMKRGLSEFSTVKLITNEIT